MSEIEESIQISNNRTTYVYSTVTVLTLIKQL